MSFTQNGGPPEASLQTADIIWGRLKGFPLWGSLMLEEICI